MTELERLHESEPMPATKQTIRVLLADDHDVVRAGLRYFLATTDDIEIVGEGATGEQALRRCDQLLPDVVVLDLMMPELDGIAAMRQILKAHPHVRVVALTSFATGELVQQALQAGATSYLLKDATGHEVAQAIRSAYTGQRIIAPEATQVLISVMTQPSRPGDDLSDRELEVLGLLIDGLSNDQIATRLVISVNTVRHHVGNILSKLNAVNRTEAVSLAMRYGLVARTPNIGQVFL